MAKETITIQSRSDLITAASGRQYFTITDDTQRKLISFNPALLDLLPLGATVKDVDVEPSKKADDTPRIISVGEIGKEEAKAKGRSYGRSDKELAQIRQLAEAQNRSIQAQTALNRAVDWGIAYAEHIDWEEWQDSIPKIAKSFYQLLQSLTLISEAKVIHKKIEEAKGETNKATSGSQETQTELTDRQDSRETIKNAGELFSWIMKQDPSIKAPRLWVQTKFGLSDKEVITDEKAVALFETIRKR